MKSIMKTLIAATVITLVTESLIIASSGRDHGKGPMPVILTSGVVDVPQEQLKSIAAKVEASRLEQYVLKYRKIAKLCEKIYKIKTDSMSMSQNQELNSSDGDNNDQQDESKQDWYELGLATAKIIKTNDSNSSNYSGMTLTEILNSENAHATGNTEQYYLGIADGLHQKKFASSPK